MIIGVVSDDVQVFIHGHSLVPRDEYVANGGLYLNPGSPTRPRGGSRKSVARLFVDKGTVKSVEFIELD